MKKQDGVKDNPLRCASDQIKHQICCDAGIKAQNLPTYPLVWGLASLTHRNIHPTAQYCSLSFHDFWPGINIYAGAVLQKACSLGVLKYWGLSTRTPLKAGGGEIVEAVENVTAGKQTEGSISQTKFFIILLFYFLHSFSQSNPSCFYPTLSSTFIHLSSIFFPS